MFIETASSPEEEKPEAYAPAVLVHWLFLLAVTAITILVDQFSKWLVVRNLEYRESWVFWSLLEGIFDFTYTRNTGAAFGMGQEFSNVFLIVAFIVTGVIIYYHRQLPADMWIVRAALGLMMGGAIGNAIDRILRGYVVDFLHLHGWPIFNLADSAIVIGVAAWVVVLWWQERQENAARPGRTEASEESSEPS
ncbi:MAG: signal peptidase II [Chloroflexi bacterium]|nr:signal peptidase II [Chloroflexota bacterium]